MSIPRAMLYIDIDETQRLLRNQTRNIRDAVAGNDANILGILYCAIIITKTRFK